MNGLAVDPSRPTVASFLLAQGYATGLVVRWHLGLGDGVTPVNFNGHIATNWGENKMNSQ